jgi:ATP phosphoribosyltransferase
MPFAVRSFAVPNFAVRGLSQIKLAAPIRYVGAAASGDDFQEKMMKFALPKGSLQDATVDLFKRANYEIKLKDRDYFPTVNDPDIGMIMFRAQDVSKYVSSGFVDAGITGRDWIIENGQADTFEVTPEDGVVEVAELLYSKASAKPARWVVAVPNDSSIKTVQDFEGKTLATELPLTTQKFFKDRGINVNVEFSWGTTEVKAKALLVDGIVDITETGSSLKANNLRIVDTIIASTTRLIANKEAWEIPEKRKKIKALAMMLQASIDGKNKVGLKANVPKARFDECLALLPAETAPTVADLTNSDYVSVEVVCTGVEARDVTPQLSELGATGIFSYPLHTIVH